MTTKFLAVPASALLLAAAVAAPALAHRASEAPPQRSTTEAHDRMMSGDHTGMARMHDRMMSDHPGMARMHEQMMSDRTDAAEPAPTPTR